MTEPTPPESAPEPEPAPSPGPPPWPAAPTGEAPTPPAGEPPTAPTGDSPVPPAAAPTPPPPTGEVPVPPVAPPAGALPTQPVATPVAEPVTAVATTVPPSDGTIRVQRWVVYALAAFAVGAIGFALGWVAAPGGGDGGRSVSVQVPRDLQNMFGRNGPFGNGSGNNNGGNNGSNGNSGGSGNGNAAPRANGAFLGVVTSSSTNPQGAQIERVVSGSPASDANLEQGDVITKVDSTSVDGPAALASAIGGHQAGDTVTITYERNGSSATAKVKLQSRSSANLGAPQAPSSNF